MMTLLGHRSRPLSCGPSRRCSGNSTSRSDLPREWRSSRRQARATVDSLVRRAAYAELSYSRQNTNLVLRAAGELRQQPFDLSVESSWDSIRSLHLAGDWIECADRQTRQHHWGRLREMSTATNVVGSCATPADAKSSVKAASSGKPSSRARSVPTRWTITTWSSA